MPAPSIHGAPPSHARLSSVYFDALRPISSSISASTPSRHPTCGVPPPDPFISRTGASLVDLHSYELGVRLGVLAGAVTAAPPATALPGHVLIHRLRRAGTSGTVTHVCHAILDEAFLAGATHALDTTVRALLAQLHPPPQGPIQRGGDTPLL